MSDNIKIILIIFFAVVLVASSGAAFYFFYGNKSSVSDFLPALQTEEDVIDVAGSLEVSDLDLKK